MQIDLRARQESPDADVCDEPAFDHLDDRAGDQPPRAVGGLHFLVDFLLADLLVGQEDVPFFVLEAFHHRLDDFAGRQALEDVLAAQLFQGHAALGLESNVQQDVVVGDRQQGAADHIAGFQGPLLGLVVFQQGLEILRLSCRELRELLRARSERIVHLRRSLRDWF
jgi:hypothetical protein